MFTINFVGEQKKARIFLTWTWQKLLWKALKNKEWIEMKFKDNFTYLFWLLNLISLTGIKSESNHISQKKWFNSDSDYSNSDSDSPNLGRLQVLLLLLLLVTIQMFNLKFK